MDGVWFKECRKSRSDHCFCCRLLFIYIILNYSLSSNGPIVKVELVNRFLFVYYCSVELVKVLSCWLSLVGLHISYQCLVLLFHCFRTNFAAAWKSYTMKYIVNTTIATTLPRSRELRVTLLTNSSKRVSPRIETHRPTSTRLWTESPKIDNSARIDLNMPEKSCWSQAQMKEEGKRW